MLMFVIQHQPHRAGTDLRGELLLVCLLMAAPSQELEPPANPGRFSRRRTRVPILVFGNKRGNSGVSGKMWFPEGGRVSIERLPIFMAPLGSGIAISHGSTVPSGLPGGSDVAP